MPILTVYARLTAMALRWARTSNDFIYIFNIVKYCLVVNLYKTIYLSQLTFI